MGGTATLTSVNRSGADFLRAIPVLVNQPEVIEYLLSRVYDKQFPCVSLHRIAQKRQQGVGVEQSQTQ
jgi:hypothetical protein